MKQNIDKTDLENIEVWNCIVKNNADEPNQ